MYDEIKLRAVQYVQVYIYCSCYIREIRKKKENFFTFFLKSTSPTAQSWRFSTCEACALPYRCCHSLCIFIVVVFPLLPFAQQANAPLLLFPPSSLCFHFVPSLSPSLSFFLFLLLSPLPLSPRHTHTHVHVHNCQCQSPPPTPPLPRLRSNTSNRLVSLPRVPRVYKGFVSSPFPSSTFLLFFSLL